jgi:hypothetical protein
LGRGTKAASRGDEVERVEHQRPRVLLVPSQGVDHAAIPCERGAFGRDRRAGRSGPSWSSESRASIAWIENSSRETHSSPGGESGRVSRRRPRAGSLHGRAAPARLVPGPRRKGVRRVRGCKMRRAPLSAPSLGRCAPSTLDHRRESRSSSRRSIHSSFVRWPWLVASANRLRSSRRTRRLIR